MIRTLFGLTCLISSVARANPSILARCTGDGFVVEVGVAPGPGGTDLAQLTVDDGRTTPRAFEASSGHGQVAKHLQVGMSFESTKEPKERGVLELRGRTATWVAGGASRALTCETP